MTMERPGNNDPMRGVALLILLAVLASGVGGALRYFGRGEFPKNDVLAGKDLANDVSANDVSAKDDASAKGASPIQFQVNLNEATLQELALLPMVGPRMAELIVQERSRLGAFAELEQLSKIPGVGPKVMESLRPYVTVR